MSDDNGNIIEELAKLPKVIIPKKVFPHAFSNLIFFKKTIQKDYN